MAKKSKKTTNTAASKRPAKRKRIVSLAEYAQTGGRMAEAEAKGDVAKTVDAVEKGNLADGITVPTAGKNPYGPGNRQAKAEAPAKNHKPSGLDAAVAVLAEAGKPMNAGDMVKRMLDTGTWQTSGKTPAATIYAAIIREISVKGDEARFRKTDRGHFELTCAGIAARSCMSEPAQIRKGGK